MKVIVLGLSYSAEEEAVKKDFAECGEIVDFGFPMDRETGQPKGLAFITYTTKEARDKALEFNETEYAGRTIRVKISESKGGGKDGKSFGGKGGGKASGKSGKGKGGGRGFGS